MRSKRVLVVAALLAVVCGAAGIHAALLSTGSAAPSTKVIVEVPQPGAPRSLTLLEAWDSITATARGWSGSWAITSLYSTDVGDAPTPASGADGRRRTWQAHLESDAGGTRWLRLSDGITTDVIEPAAVSGVPAEPPLVRPLIDSDEALQLAERARPAFSGSADLKAMGFQFSVTPRIGDEASVVTITGAHGALDARVVVDPATKKVVDAQDLALTGGGLDVSMDAGATWNQSQLGGVVLAVGADLSQTAHVVYAIVDSGDEPDIWRSQDGGHTFSRIATLPAGVRPVAGWIAVEPVESGMRLLFVGTDLQLWTFGLDDQAFTKLAAPGDVMEIQSGAENTVDTLVRVDGVIAHYQLEGAKFTKVSAGPTLMLTTRPGPVQEVDASRSYQGMQGVVAAAASQGTLLVSSTQDHGEVSRSAA